MLESTHAIRINFCYTISAFLGSVVASVLSIARMRNAHL